jgi:hypothetical protein
LKTRVDLLDQDYIDKLSPKERKWLNKFNKEYISASFEEKGNIHKTKRLKKESYDRNNARNRDILTRAKASNQLTDYEELHEETSNNDYEDYIIEELDKKDIIQAVEWLAEELGKDEQALEERLTGELEEESLSKKQQSRPKQ